MTRRLTGCLAAFVMLLLLVCAPPGFAQKNSTTRSVGVRSKVRLTMPFGANCVSCASEMIFSLPASISGCSLMPATYARSPARALMQIKECDVRWGANA